MMYLKSLDNTQAMLIEAEITAGQTIKYGDLLTVASGKVLKAGPAATGILGIAMSGGTSGKISVMVLNSKTVVRVPFTGVTKTSLTAADKFNTAFDIDANQKLNLDDTTGGFGLVVGYDNVAKTADIVIKSSAFWNA